MEEKKDLLAKLKRKGRFPNLIKGIYQEYAANIIFTNKLLEVFSLKLEQDNLTLWWRSESLQQEQKRNIKYNHSERKKLNYIIL